MLKLSSPAFNNQDFIPISYTQYGENVSPSLHWTCETPGVREFALVCLDYDVPKPQPIVHWLMYRISPATRSLPAHIPIEGDLGAPLSAYQGANTHGDYGFMGPKPPKEDPPHRYVFRLFALDRPSYAEPGLSKDEFFKKIKGHILEEAELIGFYQYEGVDAHEGLLEKAKAAVTHMFHHSH